MQLKDRRTLAKIMAIQEVSQRELATAAGWRSHSYLGRMLRGEASTCDTEAAARISRYLGVGVDDLFVVRVSSGVAQSGSRPSAKAAS